MTRPVRPGMRLTAGRLESWLPHIVQQGEDIEVVSSTTVTDTDLAVPLAASGRYLLQLRASYGSSSTGRFKSAWSVPTGTRLDRYVIGPHIGGDADNTSVVMRRRAAGTEQGVGGGITFAHYFEDCEVEVGGTAGNAVYRFAQLTSHSTATIFRAQSYVMYQRIA